MSPFTLGSFLGLFGAICALTALGWEPTLRRMTGGAAAPERFRFTPRLLPPALLLTVSVLGTAAPVVVAALSGVSWLLLLAPLGLALTARSALAVARWRYTRRLRAQVLLAVEQLAALVASRAPLLGAFRQVGASAGWPLYAEWAWVDQHLNVPIQTVEYGQARTRYSDHAEVLRRLARQTPLELHAQVLDHLAAIYEASAESQATGRLQTLAEVLREQDRLRRELRVQFGRVRGEAFIIAGAMGLIALWLLLTQTERVGLAFVESPFGPFAALWFLFWLALPIVAGLTLTRTPEVPL